MSLATLIKRLQDIMREDNGVDGDAQRLAQIVWLLFLKVFDFKEEEAELDDDYEPVIPEGYRWRDWAIGESARDQLTGDSLIEFVNNKLFPVLRGDTIKDENGNDVVIFEKTNPRSLLVKEFIKDSNNYMKKGVQLRRVINLFNEVDLSNSNESHEFNDVYESLLKGLQSAGRAGEFYTPRGLTSFIVERVNPRIGESVGDFSCGTGGFLVDALRYMKSQIKDGDINSFNLLQNTVHGIEWKPLPYMLCVTNLMLHGVQLPDIAYADAFLAKEYSDITDKDCVDVCIMNPPYGGVASETDKKTFPTDLRSSETADLFMALIMKRLKKNGRAAVILPDGFLFGADSVKCAIKKKLLNECHLHTVIRLPKSCFAPYTSIATNILFFDKTGKTEETWFYRMDMPEGYKAFSKTKPLSKEHMKIVEDWWNNRVELIDEREDESMNSTYKSKKYTYDELKANGFNFDLCGYPTKEDIILSPKETIDNFVARRNELDKKMDEKLVEIMKLLGV